MPLGPDVGANIKDLKQAHPDWSQAHLEAAALNGARSAGNHSIKPPSSTRKKVNGLSSTGRKKSR